MGEGKMKTDLTIKCTGLNENEQKTEQRFWPNFTDHILFHFMVNQAGGIHVISLIIASPSCLGIVLVCIILH